MAPGKKRAELKLKNGYVIRHEEVAVGHTCAGVKVGGGRTLPTSYCNAPGGQGTQGTQGGPPQGPNSESTLAKQETTSTQGLRETNILESINERS